MVMQPYLLSQSLGSTEHINYLCSSIDNLIISATNS